MDSADKIKGSNWKSTGAFLIFVGCFVYAVFSGQSEGVIQVTGTIALVSSLAMMLRSDQLLKLFKSFVERK